MSQTTQHARQLMRDGQSREARQHLKDLLRKNPDDAKAWALMLHLAETPERGLSCVQQVLRLKPNDAWALRQQARLLEELALQGTPTPTMRYPPVPDADDTASRLLWEAVREGNNVLVAGTNLATRQAIVEGLKVAVPPEHYPLQTAQFSAPHNPTNRTAHHLIMTLDDDDMLDLLAWAKRSEPYLIVGMDAATTEQAINRFQFFATMTYRVAADVHLKRQFGSEDIPALFAATFPFVVAGALDNDGEALIVEIARPVLNKAGQMQAQVVFSASAEVRTRVKAHTPPPATPVAQPTPQPDISHAVFTRSTVPPVYEEDIPRAKLHRPSAPATPDQQRVLLILIGVGIAFVMTVIIILLLTLENAGML